MKRDREKIYSMAKIALCVSVLSLVSYFVIPLPATPSALSLQTVAVGLTALILSPSQTAWAMVLYLTMGAVGLPVFSAGTAGLGKLFGVTGGYYFGFLFSAIAISILKGKEISFTKYTALLICPGMILQHICAVIVMCLHNGWNIKSAFISISLPFILGDIIKAVATAFLGVAINRALSKTKF